MDSLTLTFNFEFNVSLQLGDILFYKDISSGDVYMMGAVTAITSTDITCDISASTPRPEAGDFIFFAKDSEIHVDGLVGHQATVKMSVSGSEKKNLFAVSSEVFISS